MRYIQGLRVRFSSWSVSAYAHAYFRSHTSRPVAGAIVARLGLDMDESGRLDLAVYEPPRRPGRCALEQRGGVRLPSLGYDDDIRVVTGFDTLGLVARLDAGLIRL